MMMKMMMVMMVKKNIKYKNNAVTKILKQNAKSYIFK